MEGNLEDLRKQLIKHLNIPEDKISVNNLTNHVIIRQHCKTQVEEFLKMQKF